MKLKNFPKVSKLLPAKSKKGEFMWDAGFLVFGKKELPRFKKGDHDRQNKSL